MKCDTANRPALSTAHNRELVDQIVGRVASFAQHKRQPPRVYYLNRRTFCIGVSDGGFINVSRSAARMHLMVRGLTPEQADAELLVVERTRRIAYHGPVPTVGAGRYKIGQTEILVSYPYQTDGRPLDQIDWFRIPTWIKHAVLAKAIIKVQAHKPPPKKKKS